MPAAGRGALQAPISRIVSGGQTGVDRAALDFARANGLPYGGWCPQGGWAEDHERPPGLLRRYPMLRETPSTDPARRTAWNVRDSDATLILFRPGVTSPGTEASARHAAELSRSVRTVDVLDPDAPAAVRGLITSRADPQVLNVAGPRESEAPGIYREARALLDRALSDLLSPPPE
ncbi:MAG TPA: putative molybdenum carrier protein [Solirubrobacterales bacterium]|nr:putative molybdenum carrier protein [Solirubrobacterales bacterium]